MNDRQSDILNLISLILGLLNYDENLTQGDKQQIMENSNRVQDEVVSRIDSRLIKQDKKIDYLILELEKIKNQLNNK